MGKLKIKHLGSEWHRGQRWAVVWANGGGYCTTRTREEARAIVRAYRNRQKESE